MQKLVEKQDESLVQSKLPTKYGIFDVVAYESGFADFPHLALIKGPISNSEVIDVRIHSECMTGDVFGSSRCECGEQLEFSMKWVQENRGIVIYLRQEGRGIGLVNKLKAYNLQDEGMNTREANIHLGFHSDSRNYEPAINILNDLGITRIRLLTNNPDKINAFENTGIELLGRVPIEITPSPDNKGYLQTKKDEMGHLLTKI
jgi:3,4-dihydroxy 2-butanone 4-phosphate synthase/GTP cyclohydrolase II